MRTNHSPHGNRNEREESVQDLSLRANVRCLLNKHEQTEGYFHIIFLHSVESVAVKMNKKLVSSL